MGSARFPLGEIRLGSLRSDPQTSWFPIGYDLYSFTDAESYRNVFSAQREFGKLGIYAFIGVWCPDCQEHLPGFVRILDAVKFPPERLHVYSLDRAKTFPDGGELIARYQVKRLPTFIFESGGKEIGRITESPKGALIQDMAEILTPGRALC